MMTKEESQEIWQLIRNIDVVMLTTQSDEQLRARPMYQVQSRFDGTLWFITSESSAKAEELSDNRQVCLAYADINRNVYVSLSGTAGLTRDETLIDKFWNKTAEAFFDRGRDDPDVTLLEVHIERAEVWDAEKNIMTMLFEQAKARFTDSPVELGKHRTYS